MQLGYTPGITVGFDTFQFPFHRDGPCNTTLPRKISCRTTRPFQFPFHRDGPCNRSGPLRLEDAAGIFQFPFHRDGPCNATNPGWPWATISLSVPFSSGWALQFFFLIPKDKPPYLSVPFSSGWALQSHRARRISASRRLSVPFSSGWALQ